MERFDAGFFTEMTEAKARGLSAVSLAFVGDSVQTLYVRSKLCTEFDYKSEKLHRLATDKIKAKTQSEKINVIEEMFNDDELAIYKRARNADLKHFAKNASIMEYRRATGLEAVLGYLYLTQNFERLVELLKISCEI